MTKRVTVLMGGASAERDVSLRSGAAAAQALREAGFEVTLVDAG
ncbi:MAG: D-alanine--D-alanine ligase, partial [Magnetospirillum sp.]|nr:D-alanine--D-alanine ligase [Magnetospirillum sp.]